MFQNDLNFSNIQKIFESNQLLHLPTITSANVFNLVCQTNSAKYVQTYLINKNSFAFFFRPCFLIIGDSYLFEQYRSSFLYLSKQLYQQYGSHLAYLDSSSTKQIGFSKILSSIYHSNEKKLFVSFKI